MIKTHGDYQQRITDSFNKQGLMQLLDCKLGTMSAGKVEAIIPFSQGLTQQHGYFHGGITGTMADNVAGFAAFSLCEEADSVVTAEYKINFLAPAQGEFMIARAEVIKSGRSLLVVKSDVYTKMGDQERHVATGLFSIMRLIDGAKKET
ncbi:MAG: PaaI family thioesterase [OCS116 cluster bacterium]|uniref:Thioesterase domain-containing protein n=1 Tax=OCS116 cluster bacterium TaxID=2030921 RepID=A0A2A4ZAY3_9PROT|nr:PaaI family thioesterase [OCS116 cluster bacterium]